jgi:hypothetical protein
VNSAGPRVPATTKPTPTTTTTSTIPNVSVPDAVDTANTMGSVTAVQQLTEAGFIPKVVYVTDSPGCYSQDPVNGTSKWNGGAAVSQNPAPGTVGPRGVTVTLSLCAAAASVPTP